MASQGQRFRRKALRRGYKVDEVDAFLDRVEATLAGQPVGAPVASQEVHDVVFRVRFNGYDEWQVDLHLDRVERQLAELEERSAAPGGRGGDPRMADRLGPPMRDDRGLSPVPQPPMPPRQMPAQAGPPVDRYGNRYDEPTGAFAGGYDAPRGGYDAPRGPGGPGPMGPGAPLGHGGPPPRGLPPGPGGYGGPDNGPGGYGGPDNGPGGYGGPDNGPGGYGPDERFDGFEAGRHGRADMTAEIRMPERDLRDLRGRGPAGPPALPQQGYGAPEPGYGPPDQGYGPGPSMTGPPLVGPPAAGPPMVGPPMAGPPGSDLYRVDQIRRSFQVRRFGSGYDPDQVDRFFETLLGGMQGRNPMPVNPKDLDTLRFGLVPGGYFEAEVDAALKDVQDILLGR
ncbi:DivIVA domain-containing protein [Micromonospora sp. WMMA1998]|uniref:DivIVA domain-containing protein n=1 Tax=Micromonospora sp. WMMA1998 TaxID=3015167 RepID=UPI00248C8D8F|nr:DivIVA domain-containing protein [Micromonospora sp. WMMA1998]WBC14536.1 DivIVA domain-containing protein [Micromonospora sp. WMMA1998]